MQIKFISLSLMGQQGYDGHERCNFTTGTILVLLLKFSGWNFPHEYTTKFRTGN